jgi:hypothetical protein
MGDPELRSDEKVLVRTPGVYVKSIPFEGILTNKRIILIDRAKNLLPPKEIPLVTIKEVEPGENAIRDQIITLSVMAKTGETRQMILTFSRQAGGNRIKERDAWIRTIRENASSSFDQVIRKVIPGPEPAPRRTEPAGPRYEVVHSPIQPAAQPREYPPAGTGMDEISPVRRSVSTRPETTVPQFPAVRQYDTPASPPETSVFCPKCGNKVPAGSVFCNRCGSSIAPASPVSSSVQTPVVPPVPRTSSPRPIDEEIQSIEPLIERSSTVKTPPEILRSASTGSPARQSFSWDDEENAEPEFQPETLIPEEKPARNGFLPKLFSAKSPSAATPAPSYGDSGDMPPPPRPPRSRSFMPGKQTILTAAVAIVAILLVAAGALFVYPMLTSGEIALPFGSDNASPSPTSSSSTVLPSGTIVIKETPAPQIPSTGVYVHVIYLGGFKGSYGLPNPDLITTVPGNSGERLWEVENATNSTVQATFEKLDGSPHELLVEIYRDGKLLTSGTTTVGHGSVALSVDMVTGKAAAPVTSGSSSTAKTAGVAAATSPAVTTAEPAAITTTAATITSVITTVATDATTAAP